VELAVADCSKDRKMRSFAALKMTRAAGLP
jgi:hypothetical protein